MSNDTTPLICDVRALLARGVEPFPLIMESVGALAPGQALQLLAPFRPSPLIQVMERKGFSAAASRYEDGTWEVIFTPVSVTNDAAAIADWPDPARFIDCTAYVPSDAEAELSQELELLESGDVLFALLPHEPETLCRSFDKMGVRWMGKWDAEAGGYAIMIRRD